MRHAPTLLALGCLAFAVGGCKLVDQRTFDRTADRPPVPVAPPAPHVAGGPDALVSFPVSAPIDEWAGVLRTAVELARSRKPDVLFQVRTLVPPSGDPDAEASALAASLPAARAAADVIVDDGVPRAQVELSAGTAPGLHAPAIRIFVR